MWSSLLYIFNDQISVGQLFKYFLHLFYIFDNIGPVTCLHIEVMIEALVKHIKKGLRYSG